MMTVKQVSELTGVSIRTLQYYDEINLLKPSDVTPSGYRLYDEASLEDLQQIMFFKELDFTLKDIKLILKNPQFDRQKALTEQRILIKTKLDRMSNLLNLVDRLLKGEKDMSFKEFDLSDYFTALEDFKQSHAVEIIKYWGSLEEYEKMLQTFGEKKDEIGALAVKQYGSIENYTNAMKNNLENFSETMNQLMNIKESPDNYISRNAELNKKLTSDLSLDVASAEIQSIIQELVTLVESITMGANIDMGVNYWNLVLEGYLSDKTIREATDKIYGAGAADFIGGALKAYFENIS